MPRHSSIPTLYDECKTISLTSLKKWGYLKPGEWKHGGITWSRAGNQTGSISFSVDMFSDNPCLELDYRWNETTINYQVHLVSIPSNIGKGVVWYFLCPATRKRCRKLYLIGGKFLHRTAFKGCFYEKQTYSSRNRTLFRTFESLATADTAYQILHTKYFKKYYSGRPTKRYLKLQKQIFVSEKLDAREIEEMLYRK
jgi:hypothetical protein